MDTYFTKAIEVAKEKAQTDPDELSAMKYADRDIVRQAIMNHSSDTLSTSSLIQSQTLKLMIVPILEKIIRFGGQKING